MSQQLSPHTRTRLVWVNGKKVRAHRHIMEQVIGRELLPSEQVHHINKNPLDNRPENLVVMDAVDHMRLHKQIHPMIKTCEVCGIAYTPTSNHRSRQKCCSPTCATRMRTTHMAQKRGYAGW